MAYEWSEHIEYVDCHTHGITRVRRGRGFCYVGPDGKLVEDAATRDRIVAIAIPPAWREVWIAPSRHAHLQATGRDQRRRKQYRYHPAWSRARRLANYDRLGAFAAALPRIRKFVDRGLRRRVPDQACLLALVLRLLDSGMIRIGNDEYLKTNGSRGLTTLRKRDVRVAGDELKFHFIAKGGIEQRLSIHDQRAARALRRCHELGGHHLLSYAGPDGIVHRVTSSEVNALLEQLAGQKFTAKDFRTWAGRRGLRATARRAPDRQRRGRQDGRQRGDSLRGAAPRQHGCSVSADTTFTRASSRRISAASWLLCRPRAGAAVSTQPRRHWCSY